MFAGIIGLMAALGRLASVDEANLVLDHAGQVNVFLVAGLLSADGFVSADGVPDMGALRSIVGRRIDAMPQLRRVAVRDGRRHRWAEAPPDLSEHVRLVAPVSGLAGLERLCGQLMSARLRRDRPMWELLLVPGASEVGIGMVLRIHHALADGITAVAIVQQLFDPSDASAPPIAQAPADDAGPDQHVRAALTRFAFGLERMRMTLRGREVGPTMLLGERTGMRGVAFLSADLDRLEAHARPMGATVNDALLSAVAAGYRAALVAAGEDVPARLTVSVPVALRRRGTSGNQVGVMLVRLPLTEIEPDERLRLISLQTRAEKVRAREQGTLEFMRGPLGARIMDRIASRQHLVAGFVTNVPGPPGALRLGGARVVDMWPVAVLAANVRLGVAAISYDGGLRCGIHFDAKNLPGDEFARGMGEELARMQHEGSV